MSYANVSDWSRRCVADTLAHPREVGNAGVFAGWDVLQYVLRLSG